MIKVGAVDPGKDGFFATLTDAGDVQTWAMPTLNTGKGTKREYDKPAMKRLFVENFLDCDMFVLEKQQSMPGQGNVSMFTTGRGYGMLEAFCVAYELPHVIVHPRSWKKVICRDIAAPDPKKKSILTAQRLFPKVDLKKTPRCTTYHDGKADALLLAFYGLHTVMGKD